MRLHAATHRACAALCAGLLCAATAAQQAAPSRAQWQTVERPAAAESRFIRTARQLGASDPGLRAQFAATALDALAAAYVTEAEIAREQARQTSGDPRLLDWARAVEGYARQFALLLGDIGAGYPVRLAITGDRALGVTVGERTVIVAHPRLSEQPAFEQSVLGAFCRRHDCESLTAKPPATEPIPVSAGGARPVWTFSNDGAECGYRGLTVQFSRDADVGRARSTCAQFMQEAQTLAVELRWQDRHAVRIDWDALQLTSNPGRPGHTLRLNRAGDAVLATLPLVYSSRGLLDATLPWLRAQLAGEEPPSLVLKARDFGWEGG